MKSFQDGKKIAALAPQKRRYLASGSVMTEAAIDPGLFRDLYVAMGEPIGMTGCLGDTAALQADGSLDVAGRDFMGLGGLTTAFDKRYRRQRRGLPRRPGAHYAG